jgi:hypothetical protein
VGRERRRAAAGEPVARGGTAVQRVWAEHVAARERPERSVRRKWVPPRADRRALTGLSVWARGKPRRRIGARCAASCATRACGRGRLNLISTGLV